VRDNDSTSFSKNYRNSKIVMLAVKK